MHAKRAIAWRNQQILETKGPLSAEKIPARLAPEQSPARYRSAISMAARIIPATASTMLAPTAIATLATSCWCDT